jgi:UDP-glucose 4-epimerase
MAKLGWKPQYGDLATMISTAFNWFKAHPTGYGD